MVQLSEQRQALHARIPLALNLKIDEAVNQKRQQTGRRVRRTELLIQWIKEGLDRDGIGGGDDEEKE